MRVVVALALTVLVTSVVFWLAGANPLDAYAALYRGSFGNLYGIGETVALTGVLILMALAVALPARAQLWNIGGEGQMFIGALAAVVVGLQLDAPPVVTTLAALAVGTAAGGLWGMIAGVLKAKLSANEVLTTLMLNFVAILLVDYYISQASIASGIPNATSYLPPGVELAVIIPGTGINLVIVIALAATLLAQFILTRTGFGLRVRAVGSNTDASINAGVGVPRLQVLVMTLGASFAGLAGAVIVVGIQGLLVRGFSPGFGFIGIAIAMLARANPMWIIPSALVFAALTVGGSYLEPAVGLSSSAALIVQAVLLLFLLACWAFPPGRIGGNR